jgi:hypothetical protein
MARTKSATLPKLPSAAKAIDDRVAAIQAANADLPRADALGRIHGSALNDIPRLVEELEAYKAQRAKALAKDDPRDPGKKDSHDETVELGEAHVELERAVAAAVAKELGLPEDQGSGNVGAAGAAHDATVSTKEG